MILIPNLAIAGYRSFGSQAQYFERFAKINLFIGQNNAGKSNVLRFLHDMYPQMSGRSKPELDPLAHHFPSRPSMLMGIGESIESAPDGSQCLTSDHRLLTRLDASRSPAAARILWTLFNEKAKIDSKTLCWTMRRIPDGEPETESWTRAIQALDDQEVHQAWAWFTNQSGGGRKQHWEPELIKVAIANVPAVNVKMIPAIRRIGEGGSTSEGFDGVGIIDRLAKLQNPDVLNQESKKRFNAIQDFLRTVVGRADAQIEIPYARDTIHINMDGKVLPIESLGSGIHEVIILAAAATVLEHHVLCIEEPELHLNPILQKKLVRYLSNKTNNQYFMSTHSAALMDTPGAEIYHVTLDKDGVSTVDRVTSDSQRSTVCEDLGYHPSDLLQANCVIWVEGPSDRIYLNWWLSAANAGLIEGIHYSIMFYGGRLAAHLSNADPEVGDFISLRRLNRRGVIVIDSDRKSAHGVLNQTKTRLKEEFDSGPGHAWITEGREIENYIDSEQLNAAIRATCPLAVLPTKCGKYDNSLRIRGGRGAETQAPKVDVAHYVVEHNEADVDRYDLRQRVTSLVAFIRDSNRTTINLRATE